MLGEGALRDDNKNGCVADYALVGNEKKTIDENYARNDELCQKLC